MLFYIYMDPQFYNNIFTISHQSLESAVKGGLIIAAASTVYFLLFGGILGMSGLAGSLVKFPNRHATKLKAIIVLGIIFSSALVNFIYHKFHEIKSFMHLPFDSSAFVKQTSVTHLAIAGFLVGLGTDLANGCTSGHGLCGLPRFSLRSFAAVLTFLATGIITATCSLANRIPQLPWLTQPIVDKLSMPAEGFLGLCLIGAILLIITEKEKSVIAKLILFLIGVVFGCGLMIAGMSQRSKINGFLQLDENWDPSLLFVLMTGVIINVITFNLILKFIKTPAFGEKLQNPHGKVNLRLIIGSLLFGLGWGIGGLCPGPFFLTIPSSFKVAIYWGIPFFLSQKLSSILFSQKHEHQRHEIHLQGKFEHTGNNQAKQKKQ